MKSSRGQGNAVKEKEAGGRLDVWKITEGKSSDVRSGVEHQIPKSSSNRTNKLDIAKDPER